MPRPMYDWQRWFRRRKFILKRGVDYRCQTSSMVQQIRNAAYKRGLSVSLEEDNGALTVTVLKANGVQRGVV